MDAFENALESLDYVANSVSKLWQLQLQLQLQRIAVAVAVFVQKLQLQQEPYKVEELA